MLITSCIIQVTCYGLRWSHGETYITAATHFVVVIILFLQMMLAMGLPRCASISGNTTKIETDQ
jgi:hypothetical protein